VINTSESVFWSFKKYDRKSALTHMKHVFRVRVQRKEIKEEMLIVNLNNLIELTADILKKEYKPFNSYVQSNFFNNFINLKDNNTYNINLVDDINNYFYELDQKLSLRKIKQVKYLSEFVFSVFGDLIKKDTEEDSLNELCKWFNVTNKFINNSLLDDINLFKEYAYSVLHLDENHPHMHILFPSILKNGNHFKLNMSTYQVYLEYKKVLLENNWYLKYNTVKRRRSSINEYQKAVKLGFLPQEIDMFLRLENIFSYNIADMDVYKQFFSKIMPILSEDNNENIIASIVKFLRLRSSIQWHELKEFKDKYFEIYNELTKNLNKSNFIIDYDIDQELKNPSLKSDG
jgi:hypothetical protein